MSTSTDLVQREPTNAVGVDSWIDVIGPVAKLAEYIASTEFVPGPLRNKPAAVAAAMLSGRETGVGPMISLQHINVIDGRPAMSAELKRARVLAAGHELVYDETGMTRCVVRGRRRGSEHWTVVTWTKDDAERARLWGKKNWQTYPRRMLVARATSELCDLLFPDVVGGLATAEVLEDGDLAELGTVTDGPPDAPPAGKRTARRRKATAASTAPPPQQPADDHGSGDATPEAPPLPGESGAEGDQEQDPPSAPAAPTDGDGPQASLPVGASSPSGAQNRMMHALFNELQITDRDERLQITSRAIGRDVTSSSELTGDEAASLIDTLVRIKELAPDDAAGLLRELTEGVGDA